MQKCFKLAHRCDSIVAVVLGVLFLMGCKNSLKADTLSGEGPETSLDYSYVKFATYYEDRVLSAGEYLGESGRSELLERAQKDLAKSSAMGAEPCGSGTHQAFCYHDENEPVQWIQLFMPDGSSCGVGPVPEEVELKSCQ